MLSVSYYKYQLLWKEIKSGKSIFQISHKSHSLFVSSQTLGKKTGNTFSKPHENLDLNVLSLSIIHSRQSVNKMMFDSDRKWKLFITKQNCCSAFQTLGKQGMMYPFSHLLSKKTCQTIQLWTIKFIFGCQIPSLYLFQFVLKWQSKHIFHIHYFKLNIFPLIQYKVSIISAHQNFNQNFVHSLSK